MCFVVRPRFALIDPSFFILELFKKILIRKHQTIKNILSNKLKINFHKRKTLKVTIDKVKL